MKGQRGELHVGMNAACQGQLERQRYMFVSADENRKRPTAGLSLPNQSKPRVLVCLRFAHACATSLTLTKCFELKGRSHEHIDSVQLHIYTSVWTSLL